MLESGPDRFESLERKGKRWVELIREREKKREFFF